ncbi:MAG: type II toxin-antitoxin system HicA family toxin [Pyrinomonadaceae bacterium]
MTRLPSVSGKKCVKVLEKFGFEVYRQRGSHVTLVRSDPPNQTTVPLHKELDRGTLRAILRQTEIGVDDFISKL